MSHSLILFTRKGPVPTQWMRISYPYFSNLSGGRFPVLISANHAIFKCCLVPLVIGRLRAQTIEAPLHIFRCHQTALAICKTGIVMEIHILAEVEGPNGCIFILVN